MGWWDYFTQGRNRPMKSLPTRRILPKNQSRTEESHLPKDLQKKRSGPNSAPITPDQQGNAANPTRISHHTEPMPTNFHHKPDTKDKPMLKQNISARKMQPATKGPMKLEALESIIDWEKFRPPPPGMNTGQPLDSSKVPPSQPTWQYPTTSTGPFQRHLKITASRITPAEPVVWFSPLIREPESYTAATVGTPTLFTDT